jgi:hypothetical protein
LGGRGVGGGGVHGLGGPGNGGGDTNAFECIFSDQLKGAGGRSRYRNSPISGPLCYSDRFKTVSVF